MNLRLNIARVVMRYTTVESSGAKLAPGAGASIRVEEVDGRCIDAISRGEDFELLYAPAPQSAVYAFSVSTPQAFRLAWFFAKLWLRVALPMAAWRWARSVVVDEEQRVAFLKWRKARSNG